jgi:hypothetical protein
MVVIDARKEEWFEESEDVAEEEETRQSESTARGHVRIRPLCDLDMKYSCENWHIPFSEEWVERSFGVCTIVGD